MKIKLIKPKGQHHFMSIPPPDKSTHGEISAIYTDSISTNTVHNGQLVTPTKPVSLKAGLWADLIN